MRRKGFHHLDHTLELAFLLKKEEKMTIPRDSNGFQQIPTDSEPQKISSLHLTAQNRSGDWAQQNTANGYKWICDALLLPWGCLQSHTWPTDRGLLMRRVFFVDPKLQWWITAPDSWRQNVATIPHKRTSCFNPPRSFHEMLQKSRKTEDGLSDPHYAAGAPGQNHTLHCQKELVAWELERHGAKDVIYLCFPTQMAI